MPTYTESQAASAKTNVCIAYRKVEQALDIAGTRNGGDNQTATLAVATDVQVLDFGDRYLVAALAEQPATPPDLAKEVRTLANVFQQLTLAYLDVLTNNDAVLKPTLNAGDEAQLTIEWLCK